MTDTPDRMGNARPPVDLRRRWLAITAATVVLQFAYWPMVAAAAAFGNDAGEDPVVGGGLAFGLAIVPLVFMVAGFASQNERAAGSTLRAMGLFVMVALPVALLSIVLGAAVGLSAGGVVALRREDHLPSTLRWRWAAVGITGVYLLVMLVVVPGFALMSGAVLPLAVHGIVDQVLEERAARPLP